MAQRTFTRADLEQMAAATAAADPIPEDQRKADAPAARVLLAALAEGRPATVEELAPATGLTPDGARAALRAVNDVEWDDAGRVTGLGMTLNPTPHRVQARGHPLYAWCAADALGILPAIGRTVQISSQCPQTGQPVTVTAGPDGVRDIQPPQAVVSAVITGDPDDIRGSGCDLGRFFASPAAAAASAAEHPDGVLLTVPDAFHYASSLMRHLLKET